jgi:hypothetical protein
MGTRELPAFAKATGRDNTYAMEKMLVTKY